MNEFDKLELSTETIRELSAEELREVAGGAEVAVTLTGYYPSINYPCVSRFVCTD
jgi:hypothetical protein